MNIEHLLTRIDYAHRQGRISDTEHSHLLTRLARGLAQRQRTASDVQKTTWVATGLPPKRPKSHVTAPPAPQRPLPAASVAPLTPKEKAYRAIIDAAEELMERRGGKITQAEAVAEVVQRKPHLYTAYRNASDDKSGGTAA